LATPLTHALAALSLGPPPEPSRILVVLNAMNTVEQDWTDEYYEEVLEDFQHEARRWGNVMYAFYFCIYK